MIGIGTLQQITKRDTIEYNKLKLET